MLARLWVDLHVIIIPDSPCFRIDSTLLFNIIDRDRDKDTTERLNVEKSGECSSGCILHFIANTVTVTVTAIVAGNVI